MENLKADFWRNVPAPTRESSWRDQGARWWNRALDALARVDAQTVLNTATASRGNVSGNVDMELRRLMNRLHAEAYDAERNSFDYARVASSDLFLRLRETAALLVAFDPLTLRTEEQQLAFWINLYNVLVMQGVIAFGMHKTVWEDWGFFRRTAYCIGGQRIAADHIEHGILRRNQTPPYTPFPVFAPTDSRTKWMLPRLDPRIHAALHCASRSCPPIAVYDPANIFAQLDLAARAFVNATTHLDFERTTIFLSPIFKWYAQDFGGRDGILEFVSGYWQAEAQANRLWDARAKLRLAWTRYDWTLNR
ncbi:MAG: DUF547 domain-containing protein [Chloroflexi bacterium]|nr:DUF547 domain-containing protein [Chloroflexota bacterium]